MEIPQNRRKWSELPFHSEPNKINKPNTNKPTHFTTAPVRICAIDLTVCNSRIAQNISWNVQNNLFDSDHFTIMIIY